MPRTVEPELYDEYAMRRVADQRGRYLVPVQGARLIGAKGLVILPDGSFAAESRNSLPELENDPDYLARRRRKVVSKPGNYFSLVLRWSATPDYGHWFHDTLTRLHGVRDHLPSDTTFVVPANLNQYQQDSLRLMGIADNQPSLDSTARKSGSSRHSISRRRSPMWATTARTSTSGSAIRSSTDAAWYHYRPGDASSSAAGALVHAGSSTRRLSSSCSQAPGSRRSSPRTCQFESRRRSSRVRALSSPPTGLVSPTCSSQLPDSKLSK